MKKQFFLTWQASLPSSPPAHNIVFGMVKFVIRFQDFWHLILSQTVMLISCNTRDEGPLKYSLPHPKVT